MNPGIHNIPNHYKGDTFDATVFTIKEDGVVIDLTGVVIKMQFRIGSNVGVLYHTLASTKNGGITINDPTAGQFTIDEHINDWDAQIYFYDAQFTFASGIIRTYFKGQFSIDQDTTDDE